ncbi:MAG: THUMP domain-containing protein [Candidatus Hodarchaeales archaeon]
MSFLISSQRNVERDALSELYYVITDVLGYPTQPMKSRVPGLSILRLKNDQDNPLDVLVKVRQYIVEKGPLLACLKVTPLEVLIKTNLETIVQQTFTIASDRIMPDNSWRIRVRKRQTNFRTSEIIENIAAKINWGIVNLDNPDWEIRVEVIRDLTGISIMRPDDELKMKIYTEEII